MPKKDEKSILETLSGLANTPLGKAATGRAEAVADKSISVTDQSLYTKDGKGLKVDDGGAAAEAFRSGQLGLKHGQKVTIRRPDTNELVSVTAENLDAALDQGAQIATNKEHRQALLEKKYAGTPLAEAANITAAAHAGFARDFSFGASDKIATEVSRIWEGDEGAKKKGQELKELAEYAPGTTTAAGLVGMGVQMAIPIPGLGAAGRAAKGARAAEGAIGGARAAEGLFSAGRGVEAAGDVARATEAAAETVGGARSGSRFLLPEISEGTLAERALAREGAAARQTAEVGAEAYNAERAAEGIARQQAESAEALLGLAKSANKGKALKGKKLADALMLTPERMAELQAEAAAKRGGDVVLENIFRTKGGVAPPKASLFEALRGSLPEAIPEGARLVDGGIGTSAKFLGGEARIAPEVLREARYPLARLVGQEGAEFGSRFAQGGSRAGVIEAEVIDEVAYRAAQQRAAVSEAAALHAESIGNTAMAQVAAKEAVEARGILARMADTGRLIAQKTARGAVEGAGYGVAGQMGHNVSESAFEDSELTAQKLLAGTGDGAIFGALFGGGLGAAGASLGAMRKAVAPELSKLGTKLAFDLHGNMPKKVQNALNRLEGGPASAASTLSRFPDVVATDAEKSLAGIKSSVDQVIAELNTIRGGDTRIAGENIFRQIAEQPYLTIAGKTYTQGQAAKTFPWFKDAQAAFMRDEINPTLQKLGLVRVGEDGAIQYLPHNNDVRLADLLEQRMGLDTTIRWDANNQGGAARNELRKAFRSSLEKVIENEIGRGANGSNQLAKLKELKKDYQVLRILEDHVTEATVKDQTVVQNFLPKNSFGLGMLGALGGGPAGAVSALIGKTLWNNGGKAATASKLLQLGELSAVKGATAAFDLQLNKIISRSLTSNAVGNLNTVKGDKQSIDKQYAAASADFDKMKALAADPAKMTTRLTDAYGGLAGNMPGTHSAAVGTVTRAVQFLQSKEPPKMGEVNALQPGLNRNTPSDSDKQKFVLYNRTIRDPLTAIRDFQNGSIAPEQVEALKAVYPKLYDDVRQRVLMGVNRMTQDGKEIPYRRRLELASLFQAPDLDPTLNPAYIQQIQGTYGAGTQAPPEGQPPQQQGPGGKPSSPISGFSNMMTKYTAVERRMR